MAMSNASSTKAKRQEIEALGLMATEAEILCSLKRIASTYGQVIRVFPIPGPTSGATHFFIVDFARTEDAMFASLDLDCIRYAFASLMISVHCQDNGQKAFCASSIQPMPVTTKTMHMISQG